MLCSEEISLFSTQEETCQVDQESKTTDDSLSSSGFELENVPPLVRDVLSRHSSAIPLIPNEVALHLLRIQSKYLDDHPCLCTSRFRHTLHQLGDSSHQKLDKLCNELQLLTLENCDDVSTTVERQVFFRHFLPTVFDFQSLHLYASSPEISPAGETGSCSAGSRVVPDDDERRQLLILRLESILARFVSDYRGIFAIEGECSGFKHDDEHPIVDHEHRKRHEEEDTCPEEIKLMKIACAELSLECSSTASSAAVASPVESPKKKDTRPKSLTIAVNNPTNNNLDTQAKSPGEKEKDHHIHRYYSLLRSQHHRSRSHHHSNRDTERHHHHHHHHHQLPHGHHGQQLSHAPSHSPAHQVQPDQTGSPSRFAFLEPEMKELSPGPQKWSPNFSKTSPVFRFGKAIVEQLDRFSDDGYQTAASSTAVIPARKRKDPRNKSEDSDFKKISRSSSNILEQKVRADSSSSAKLAEIVRRSKSYAEVSHALSTVPVSSLDNLVDTDSANEKDKETSNQQPFKKQTCLFYVSDEDTKDKELEPEASDNHSSKTAPTAFGPSGSSGGADDSSGSFNSRFERFTVMPVSHHHHHHHHHQQKHRRHRKSSSMSTDEDEQVSQIVAEDKNVVTSETLTTSAVAAAVAASSAETGSFAEPEIGFDIPSRLEREDSFESSLSSSPSSPSSCSSASMTSDAGHLGGGEEDEEEEEKDDDVTLRDDGRRSGDMYSCEDTVDNSCNDDNVDIDSTSMMSLPQLRRASWEAIEPVVHDHHQLSLPAGSHAVVVDRLDSPVVAPAAPPVSWLPHLRRESSSSMSSDNEEFSTRHFKMIHSQKHLDPTHIQRLPTEEHPSKRNKLRQLNKQLRHVKHKLEELERQFELKQGYKPSQVEKQNNDAMRKLMSEHSRLRKQIQSCKESDFGHVDTVSGSGGSSLTSDDSCDSFFSDGSGGGSSAALMSSPKRGVRSLESMNNFFQSVVQTIKTQRVLSGRPESFDDMSPDQLLEEKRELKSALFQFSETFGHPVTEDEKNVTKDVYDRYLSLKRLIRKNSANFRAKESNELETIPEDLEIPLTLASPQHRINIEVTSLSYEQRISEARPSSSSASNKLFATTNSNINNSSNSPRNNNSNNNSDDSLSLTSDENLHAMSRYELLQIQHRTREEKKHYRRIVKEKEEQFRRENILRRIPKEEKARLDEMSYNLYKKSKAKLKLIEALLSKGRQ